MLMGQSYEHILSRLPYGEPFLFVDRIAHLDQDRVEGYYRFKPEADFYRGHFRDLPVTPGVLLTECCAQIGLACLGMYLMEISGHSKLRHASVALSETSMQFLHPVYPGEEVRVTGEKLYFRFNKLKASVRLYTADGTLACNGHMAGMLKSGMP